MPGLKVPTGTAMPLCSTQFVPSLVCCLVPWFGSLSAHPLGIRPPPPEIAMLVNSRPPTNIAQGSLIHRGAPGGDAPGVRNSFSVGSENGFLKSLRRSETHPGKPVAHVKCTFSLMDFGSVGWGGGVSPRSETRFLESLRRSQTHPQETTNSQKWGWDLGYPK